MRAPVARWLAARRKKLDEGVGFALDIASLGASFSGVAWAVVVGKMLLAVVLGVISLGVLLRFTRRQVGTRHERGTR